MTGKHWMRRAVLAAAGGLAGSAQAQVPAVPAQGPIERVWSWGFPEVLALTLSPEGERVLVLCRDGTLQCHKSTGERLWRRKQPDVDWMSTSLGAELTVLWAARRPEHAVVHFVDRTGHYYQYLDI
ncbi:MAG: hypothetical protein FJX77_01585, partial [Armatimonadetes bacterium]|nr:hypothetical protein [Armatimonadota bacterium]